MDLLKLLPTDFADVVLKHPANGSNLDVSIRVCGKDSAHFKNVAKQQKAKMTQVKKTDEEEEKESIEFLADCTIGWSGVSEGGNDIVFSREAAITLYSKYKWIREQVNLAIIDRSNFFLNA